MSELPFADYDPDDPDGPDEPEEQTRGRALWAFAALASAAVIIVALMVVFLGEPTGSNGEQHDNLAIPAPTRTATAAAPGSSSATSSPATPSTSSSPRHSPTSSSSSSARAPRTSCPSSAPCVSPGDPGEVIAAINSYRQRNGATTVSGKVTNPAQKCAVELGNLPGCPDSYFWEPVATADGTEVVQKVAAHSGGGQWLLDPKATSFAVGWAFVPGDGGHYSCAIVKTG